MAMAVGPASSPAADGGSPPPLAMGPAMMPMTVVPDAVAKDAIIGWYRGEFAAANAIIDALCGHLTQLGGGGGEGSEYSAVFAAIHRRRMNWIPVLQMQKYHSIADVMVKLRNLGAKMTEREAAEDNCKSSEGAKSCVEDEKVEEISNGNEPAADEVTEEDGSPESDITDSADQNISPVFEFEESCLLF